MRKLNKRQQTALDQCRAAFAAHLECKYAWCCHHACLYEKLSRNPDRSKRRGAEGRIDYILSTKASFEWIPRFNNFRPMIHCNEVLRIARLTRGKLDRLDYKYLNGELSYEDREDLKWGLIEDRRFDIFPYYLMDVPLGTWNGHKVKGT